MAAARETNSKYFKSLESEFHDIQLFGNREQLDLLNEIFESYSKSNGADLEPLLNSLRTELRTMLGLSEAEFKLKFFRAVN